MSKIVIFILLLISILVAEDYEDKFYKDSSNHPSGIGFHSDISHSSYLIEFHSSEIDSSIDYDILEYTLGASFSYDDWVWGVYTRILIDEIKSNMYILSSKERLHSYTNIEKDEFGIYTTYKLFQTRESSLKLNIIYRESSFEAEEKFSTYHNYESLFYYKTVDIGASFLYAYRFNKKHQLLGSVGVLFSRSIVNISESVDSKYQDSYIDTESSAIGSKLMIGYSYCYSDKLMFSGRVDGWKLSFDELNVNSRIGDRLPKGSLEERSFSTYIGFSLLF